MNLSAFPLDEDFYQALHLINSYFSFLVLMAQICMDTPTGLRFFFFFDLNFDRAM